MEGKDITRIFWNNVNEVRNARGMTWEELGRECGHGSHTLMSMKAMNRTPSFEFALEIAGALGTDVESLSSEDHVHEECTGPMTDVLAGAARGLRDEDIVLPMESRWSRISRGGICDHAAIALIPDRRAVRTYNLANLHSSPSFASLG